MSKTTVPIGDEQVLSFLQTIRSAIEGAKERGMSSVILRTEHSRDLVAFDPETTQQEAVYMGTRFSVTLGREPS